MKFLSFRLTILTQKPPKLVCLHFFHFIESALGSDPVLPLNQNGWFATGDLRALTPDANLLYKGRKDNLFISGGENIHPEEIEKELNALPNVIASVVIPINDIEFGQRPIAFLHMTTKLPSQKDLQEALLPKLPKFCIPVQFHPFPEELKQDLKIQRARFKELKIFPKKT